MFHNCIEIRKCGGSSAISSSAAGIRSSEWDCSRFCTGCGDHKKNYLLIGIAVQILAVTNAFLCYKWIVFRTHGNYLREYLKCWTVYGSSALIGTAGMILLVELAGMNPIRANILITALSVIWSYLGHRFFSFRSGKKSGTGSASH